MCHVVVCPRGARAPPPTVHRVGRCSLCWSFRLATSLSMPPDADFRALMVTAASGRPPTIRLRPVCLSSRADAVPLPYRSPPRRSRILNRSVPSTVPPRVLAAARPSPGLVLCRAVASGAFRDVYDAMCPSPIRVGPLVRVRRGVAEACGVAAGGRTCACSGTVLGAAWRAEETPSCRTPPAPRRSTLLLC